MKCEQASYLDRLQNAQELCLAKAQTHGAVAAGLARMGVDDAENHARLSASWARRLLEVEIAMVNVIAFAEVLREAERKHEERV
jgi:hypothetical protein